MSRALHEVLYLSDGIVKLLIHSISKPYGPISISCQISRWLAAVFASSLLSLLSVPSRFVDGRHDMVT